MFDPYFLNFISCCYQECSLQTITRPIFKSRPIKRHNLVDLWALLALFLGKIFDQFGGSE